MWHAVRLAARLGRPPMTSHQTSPGALPALGLAAVIVYLSFQAGGFFAGTVALVAAAMGLALALHVVLAQRPFAAVSPAFAVGAIALGLLAVWTLVSSAWSHAPARAIVEHDRVLLYLLAFVVFGLVGRGRDRLRWAVRAIAAAAFVVCLCALITRLLPDVWSVAPPLTPGPQGRPDRLSYPLTYWNALGMLAGLGLIACLALTSDLRESPAGRVLAAAALPVLGLALLLTFSRGAIAASAVGVVALVAVGRPAGLLGGLPAAAATALAVTVAYRADLLVAGSAAAQATAQEHEVAVVVVLCVALAAVGRAALLRVDVGLAQVLHGTVHRLRLAWIVAAVVGVVVAVALGAPGTIQRQYEGFVKGDPVNSSADLRDRLTRGGDNGRLDQWQVALDAFQRAPLRGQGGGTFALSWDRERSGGGSQVLDGHSLYVETLGELGIVGLLLVLSALLLVLGGFLSRARGPDRVAAGALFGCGVAWALVAGVDWIWEMPAATLFFFAAGGLALARDDVGGSASAPMKPPLRVAVAIVCLALVVVPARFYLSDLSLSDGERAFARGDCATALDRASDSIAILSARPEPYRLLGYCRATMGAPRLGVRALADAVRHDPDSWTTHFGLAVARAAAGMDPRPEARLARRLRPGERRTQDLLRLFDTEDPALWKRRALVIAAP
ncbi:MAG: hypothetical protein QOI64_1618 [Solirubrobacteraceae bacterium]|nr:hypothetical protein [Solirubrobacteraceae bacterium]